MSSYAPAASRDLSKVLAERARGTARRWLPAWLARAGKRAAVRVRYRHQLRRGRTNYRLYGDRYPHHLMLVAGLPKSGTTWLESMATSRPGLGDLYLPELADWELRPRGEGEGSGGSHDFELPPDAFTRLSGVLAFMKWHMHGSPNNAKLVRDAGVPLVVLHRDLRDVAVSNHFYVQRTPWHPEYPFYAGRTVHEGLEVFAERTLDAYAAWVRSWAANRDPERSLMLRYEDLLADTAGCLSRVSELFGLGLSAGEIEALVEANSFKRMSGGRDRGQEAVSFVRKGTSGDWRNHFTPRLGDVYREKIGGFLVEFGYEDEGSAW